MRIATPYKHPISGIYYFRRAVPNDCRRILNRAIIKESLHTREPHTARRLFAIKQEECEKLFESARSGCINVNSSQHNVNDTKLVIGALLVHDCIVYYTPKSTAELSRIVKESTGFDLEFSEKQY